MKKIILFLAVAAVALAGCKQEDVGRFDFDYQMLRPVKSTAGFSFEVSPEGGTIAIPFEVVGQPEDRDREIAVQIAYYEVDFDDNKVMPFPESKVEVLGGIVPAGETRGTVTLRFSPPSAGEVEDVDDFEKYILVVAGYNDDFQGGPESGSSSSLRFRDVQVCLSTKLVAPDSWPTLQAGSLGRFSSAYYKFIMEVTGLSEYPIQAPIAGMNLDSQGNPQKWNDNQAQTFIADVRAALVEYNNAHPDAHLTHDSGVAKGFEVVVGQWDYE